jgi:hypothetical protein
MSCKEEGGVKMQPVKVLLATTTKLTDKYYLLLYANIRSSITHVSLTVIRRTQTASSKSLLSITQIQTTIK